MSSEIPVKSVIAGKVSRFEADEPEIALLKAWFLVHSPKKLLLRKGEDYGGFALQVTDALIRGTGAFTSYHSHYLGNPTPGPIEIGELLSRDPESIIKWYLWISKGREMAEMQFRWFLERVMDWISTKHNPTQSSGKCDLRIICWPDVRNERARGGWEEEGYQVRHYVRKKDAGSHRLYIASNRYAMFHRAPDGRFFGFVGEDNGTVERLTQLFEQEWRAAKQPKQS